VWLHFLSSNDGMIEGFLEKLIIVDLYEATDDEFREYIEHFLEYYASVIGQLTKTQQELVRLAFRCTNKWVSDIGDTDLIK
jgi:hypothetical protein